MTGAVCPFCTISEDKAFYLSPLVLATWDRFPVSPGHALIIPRRLCETWFEADPQEQAEWLASWFSASSIRTMMAGFSMQASRASSSDSFSCRPALLRVLRARMINEDLAHHLSANTQETAAYRAGT